MALKRLSVPDSASIVRNGSASAEHISWMNDVAEQNNAIKSVLDGTIVDERMLVVQYVENTDYPIFRNLSYPITILQVTSKSASGTATATIKIGTTALGGTANSVSSSEQVQSHTSANEAAASDDVKATISSNSSCEMMELSIKYTRPLIV